MKRARPAAIRRTRAESRCATYTPNAAPKRAAIASLRPSGDHDGDDAVFDESAPAEGALARRPSRRSHWTLPGRYLDSISNASHPPFGDHTGFYSEADLYPQVHVTALTMRRNPVYATTIVGRPPMEDYYLGHATERIFLPLLKLTITGIVSSVAPAIERKQNQRLLAASSATRPASPDGNTRAAAHTVGTCRSSSPRSLTPKKRDATRAAESRIAIIP